MGNVEVAKQQAKVMWNLMCIGISDLRTVADDKDFSEFNLIATTYSEHLARVSDIYGESVTREFEQEARALEGSVLQ